MVAIAAAVPEYQPLRFLWRSFVRPRTRNHRLRPDSPVTRVLVPSIYWESISQSSLQSIQPFLNTDFSNPCYQKIVLWVGGRICLLFFLLSFIFIAHFSWACVIPGIFIFITPSTYFFNNSLISL